MFKIINLYFKYKTLNSLKDILLSYANEESEINSKIESIKNRKYVQNNCQTLLQYESQKGEQLEYFYIERIKLWSKKDAINKAIQSIK